MRYRPLSLSVLLPLLAACQPQDLSDTAEYEAAVDSGVGPSDAPEGEEAPEGTAEPMSGFAYASCRSGFTQAGSRLCISSTTKSANTYAYATYYCRSYKAHVCTYEDLTYLYYASSLDATYNPKDKWIGNMIDDDTVMCGNKTISSDGDSDIYNFEGTCSKTDKLAYWCCHDDDDGT